MTTPPIVPGSPQPEPEPAAPTTPPQPTFFQAPVQYGPYGPYGPPVPQIVTKPGGLSGAAHAVHILAGLLTCGLWFIGYAIIAAAQPRYRYEVIVPYGADPAQVQQAYAQAHQAQMALRAAQGKPATPTPTWVPIVWGAAVLAALVLLAYVASWLGRS